MPRKASKKKNLSTVQKVGIGVGITAAAATAAGAYFLYGSKDAKKNRTKVKSWVLKAKAEVLEALEQAEHMTQEEYEMLIDGVSKGYGKLREVTGTEVSAFEREMKSHWKGIEKSGVANMAKSAVKNVVKKATAKKKVPKKPVKKTSKKATKKTAKKATKKTAKK